MAKKLTAAAINKLNKDFDQKKAVRILGDYEVNIDIKFRNSKIDKVIFDYLNLYEESHRNNKMDEKLILGTVGVLNTLILREFSDVPNITNDRNLEKLLQVTNALYDTGIMEEVMLSFDKSERDKVFKRLDESSKHVGEFIAEYTVRNSVGGAGLPEENQESQ